MVKVGSAGKIRNNVYFVLFFNGIFGYSDSLLSKLDAGALEHFPLLEIPFVRIYWHTYIEAVTRQNIEFYMKKIHQFDCFVI